MAHFPHGAIAAAHTERERKRMEEEEEKMTTYSKDELDNNWEFKIVRSDSGAFRKPENLQMLIEEEGISGWEMLEKLDDHRVRFKRPKSARDKDFSLPPGIDPYRSQYGGSVAKTKLLISLGSLMLALITVGYLFMAERSSGGIQWDSIGIQWGYLAVNTFSIVALIALIWAAFIIIKRRR